MNVQPACTQSLGPADIRPTILLLYLFTGAAFLACIGFAQADQLQLAPGQTNVVYQVPTPTDLQRLQYYYASYQNTPAPGTEQAVFALNADRTWSGTWNSSVVPAPSRAQLDALTPQQVDLFRRAGVYTNGAWRVMTSQINSPLSTLTVSSSTYAQIRGTADRDHQLARHQRLQPQGTNVQQQVISP